MYAEQLRLRRRQTLFSINFQLSMNYVYLIFHVSSQRQYTMTALIILSVQAGVCGFLFVILA